MLLLIADIRQNFWEMFELYSSKNTKDSAEAKSCVLLQITEQRLICSAKDKSKFPYGCWKTEFLQH